MLKIKIFLEEGGKMPQKGKQGDAGLDVFACLDQTIVANQFDLVKIPLGFRYAFWEDGEVSHNFWFDVKNRSGVGINSGFTEICSVGDANYRGILHYCAVKTTPNSYVVEPGDKIAQLLINPFVDPHKIEIVQVSSIEELGASSRGANGFNSSGTK